MKKNNFKKAFGKLHGIEGDFSNDPDDQGGATRYGITEAVARRNGYEGGMLGLPIDVAMDIYYKEYWRVAYLDEVADVDFTLAYEIFEAGVNCGVHSVGKWVQRVINVMNKEERLYPDIEVDGWIGANTFNPIETLSDTKYGILILTVFVNVFQGMRYVTLGERNHSQEKFIWGWAKRVVLGDYGF